MQRLLSYKGIFNVKGLYRDSVTLIFCRAEAWHFLESWTRSSLSTVERASLRN